MRVGFAESRVASCSEGNGTDLVLRAAATLSIRIRLQWPRPIVKLHSGVALANRYRQTTGGK